MLNAILTALGFFKVLVQWFRERSIHDAGVNAERLRLQDAEIKAQNSAQNVEPVSRDAVVDRLRSGGF